MGLDRRRSCELLDPVPHAKKDVLGTRDFFGPAGPGQTIGKRLRLALSTASPLASTTYPESQVDLRLSASQSRIELDAPQGTGGAAHLEDSRENCEKQKVSSSDFCVPTCRNPTLAAARHRLIRYRVPPSQKLVTF